MKQNNLLFDMLGFYWDRTVIPFTIPIYSINRVVFRFHKLLAEFVWDAAALKGNPFTFPEVKTLLDGISVGGRRLSDQEQIINLAESSKWLLTRVKNKKFELSKPIFAEFNYLVTRKEALEWGVFRGEGQEINYTPEVSLGQYGRYRPLPTRANAPELNQVFNQGVTALQSCPPFERALAFFLFGALQQFFFDGNKRSSRLMMNGILMTHGIDAISIPAAKTYEFNEKIVYFYLSKNATEMMKFLIACHPSC